MRTSTNEPSPAAAKADERRATCGFRVPLAIRCCALVGAVFLPVCGSFGEVVLSDSFPSTGDLVGTTPAIGGIWTVIGTADGSLDTSAGRLQIQDDNSEDATSSFAASQSVSLFASFTMNLSSIDLPSVGGDFWAAFRSGGSYQGRLFTYRPAGTGAGNYRLGISGTGAAADVGWATDLLPNTDYTVVLGFTQNGGSDVISLWVNPISQASLSISTTPAAINTAVAGFAFRQTAATGDLTVDNLIVATSFSEAVPEPGASALLAMSVGLAGLRRRRK